MEIKKYIVKLLKEKSKVNVPLNSQLSTLPIDSLDLIEIIVEIEKKFKIEVPDNKLESLKDMTINQLITFLMSLQK